MTYLQENLYNRINITYGCIKVQNIVKKTREIEPIKCLRLSGLYSQAFFVQPDFRYLFEDAVHKTFGLLS